MLIKKILTKKQYVLFALNTKKMKNCKNECMQSYYHKNCAIKADTRRMSYVWHIYNGLKLFKIIKAKVVLIVII